MRVELAAVRCAAMRADCDGGLRQLGQRAPRVGDERVDFGEPRLHVLADIGFDEQPVVALSPP